jgi:hypothetical protein
MLALSSSVLAQKRKIAERRVIITFKGRETQTQRSWVEVEAVVGDCQ